MIQLTPCIAMLATLALATLACATARAAPVQPYNQKLLPVELAAPVPRLPAQTLLRSLNTSPSAPAGRLVYIGGYLVIAGVGKAAHEKGAVATYDIKLRTPESVFVPQFSPNGQYVLFRVGWPWDYPGLFRFYLLNRKTHKVEAGPAEAVSHELAYWSPDSNYIAYIVRADQLRIFDVRQRKSRSILQGAGVADLAWTNQGTLLVALQGRGKNAQQASSPVKKGKGDELKGGEAREADIKAKSPTQADLEPGIYEIALDGAAPQSIGESGYTPLPSPDGRWIAYFSPSYPPGDPIVPSVPEGYLYLYDRSAQNRYRLLEQKLKPLTRDAYAAHVTLCWTQDSKRLIVAETTYNVKDGKGQGEARISAIDVMTRTPTPIVTLTATDSVPIPRPGHAPQFRILQVSHDNRFLILMVDETPPSKNRGITESTGYLRAVDLQDGTVVDLAAAKGGYGVDWHDESTGGEKPRQQKVYQALP